MSRGRSDGTDEVSARNAVYRERARERILRRVKLSKSERTRISEGIVNDSDSEMNDLPERE